MSTLFLALTAAVEWKYSTGIMENIDARTQEELEMCQLCTANERRKTSPCGQIGAQRRHGHVGSSQGNKTVISHMRHDGSSMGRILLKCNVLHTMHRVSQVKPPLASVGGLHTNNRFL